MHLPLPRIYGCILVALITWAVLHCILVHTFLINPWKLNGMAMYVNKQTVNIGVIDTSDGEQVIVPLEAFGKEERIALAAAMRSFDILGTLRKPNALADQVFAFHPEIDSLTILVHHTRLHPFTGMEVMRVLTYDYGR